MAHAELTQAAAGEAMSPRRRSLAASLEACARDAGRNSGGDPGRRRDRHPVRRRGLALRAAQPADLVGRTGLDPVPVAGDAGRRGGVPPLRAHADDRGRRQREAGDAGLSRRRRDLRRAGVSAADRVAGLRLRLRGKLHHHAGAADSQYLARRGAAGRHRPDGAVCVAAAGAGRRYQDRAGRGAVGRAADRGFLAGAAVAAAARQHQPDHLLCRRGRLLRLCRRADRLRVRAGDLRLSRADHAHAADGAGRPHGRGHEPSDPAGGAAVRVPRAC